MSLTITPESTRSRKRFVALGLIVAVVAAAFAGEVTQANLNQTIKDGDGSSHIYSDPVDDFGFVYHSATQTMNADISLTDTTQFNAQNTVFVVENVGDIPAQYVFSVDPDSVPTIDPNNPIWDEAYAIVHIPTNSGLVDQWAGTVREFLTTSFVTNEVLAPGESTGVTVEILPPTTYTWTSEESAAAVDISINTRFTFNQLTDPTNSPLYLYALAHGTQRYGVLDPDMNEWFRERLTSSMTHSWLLPSSEVASITL